MQIYKNTEPGGQGRASDWNRTSNRQVRGNPPGQPWGESGEEKEKRERGMPSISCRRGIGSRDGGDCGEDVVIHGRSGGSPADNRAGVFPVKNQTEILEDAAMQQKPA